MMRNIVLPGCWLVPGCVGVSYLTTRADAAPIFQKAGPHIFPRNITLDNPVQEYCVMGINAALIRGEKIHPLEAPHEYQEQAVRYCQLVAADKKLITITLRECSYHPQRNSQLGDWKRFIDYLDTSKYKVIIVRDTEKMLTAPVFDDVEECSLASINLLFRSALYQHSYLTMHVSNGTSCVANHSLTPSITFGVYDEEHAASSLDFFKRTMGQSYGDQWYGFPICQRLVWEKDSFDLLKTEFESITAILEQYPDGAFPAHDFGSSQQCEDTCENVVEYTVEKINKGVQKEDIDALVEVVALTKGTNAISLNALGVAYSGVGDNENAAVSFQRAIQLDDTYQMAQQNLAAIRERISGLADDPN